MFKQGSQEKYTKANLPTIHISNNFSNYQIFYFPAINNPSRFYENSTTIIHQIPAPERSAARPKGAASFLTANAIKPPSIELITASP